MILSCHSAYSQSAHHGGGMIVNRPPAPAFPDPTQAGDVVGRNLDSVLGVVGHVGMWDGGNVVEVLDPSAGPNAIHYNSLANFKSRTTYWGAATPKIPNYTVYNCFDTSCTSTLPAPQGPVQSVSTRIALVQYARQQYLIGADYTVSPSYLRAYPADGIRNRTRGRYRCDTFILSVYTSTIPYGNNYQTNRPVDATWQSRLLNIWTAFPANLFLTLNSWS